MTLEDARLTPLLAKLEANQPLDAADARTLYRSHDLHGIAQLANLVRERHHGNRAWRRLDLGDPPVLDVPAAERIQLLLALPPGEEYEPPLEPQLSGFAYLKHIAVARLLLGGQRIHIVARHCQEVENVCQLALSFGADTLVGANVTELERQILAAGRVLGE
jgi:2-iminoacetate synthase ThiH